MPDKIPIVVHYLWVAHIAVLVWIIVLALLLAFLHKTNAIPSISSFQAFVTQIDSRGGNIVVLVFFTSWILVEIHWGRLPINFWTGTAFGGFAGALFKTMTGGGSTSRTGDAGGNGVTTVDSTSTSTTTKKATTVPDAPPVVPATNTASVTKFP
jgi:hypothetical protein